MPFLQFLSGSRDQQFEALNEAASLVLGSGNEAHIRCADPGIEAKHCTVYPAQGSFWLQDMGTGSTVFNMQRMASSTQGLKAGDVFIVGRTYVKFWTEKPEVGGGGGGGGADPAALEALQKELGEAKGELEQLRSSGAGAQEQAKQLEAKLEESRKQLEDTRQELQTAQQGLEEANEKATQLEADLATASSEAQAQVAKAKEDATRERAEIESALTASRAALEALRAEAQAGVADPLSAAAGPSDLRSALDALGLPDPIRARLEAAVASEIDREVIRRSEGPVVPVRGLRLPGLDRDLESELRAIRRRGEQVDAARKLGLASLNSEELERLMELARS